MASPHSVVDSEAGRRNDLAMIHIAKAQLGWDEDHYRDVMAAVCHGIRSAGELDFALRKRFMQHLRECGWDGGSKRRPNDRSARKGKPLTPKQAKMFSLWQQLADAGLVRDRRMSALRAWCAAESKVDQMEWLNTAQENTLIESLKRWLARKNAPQGGQAGNG